MIQNLEKSEKEQVLEVPYYSSKLAESIKHFQKF